MHVVVISTGSPHWLIICSASSDEHAATLCPSTASRQSPCNVNSQAVSVAKGMTPACHTQ